MLSFTRNQSCKLKQNTVLSHHRNKENRTMFGAGWKQEAEGSERPWTTHSWGGLWGRGQGFLGPEITIEGFPLVSCFIHIFSNKNLIIINILLTCKTCWGSAHPNPAPGGAAPLREAGLMWGHRWGGGKGLGAGRAVRKPPQGSR